MKIYIVKYKYAWVSSWKTAYLAASSFDEAKKIVKNIVEKNWDIVEYVKFEYCVVDSAGVSEQLSGFFEQLRDRIPENKLNEFFVKDIIE
jgi:hypothetical protein